jgi:hypothetical protein
VVLGLVLVWLVLAAAGGRPCLLATFASGLERGTVNVLGMMAGIAVAWLVLQAPDVHRLGPHLGGAAIGICLVSVMRWFGRPGWWVRH